MDNINKILKKGKKMLYGNNEIKNIILHETNKDYNACEFTLNNKKYCFRTGKITPTKIGHFVSLWKYIDDVNSPYSANDNFDYYIFDVRENNKFGQFIFPKNILVKNKILTDNKNIGKLGFRLYAPWCDTENNTAKKTQKWQVEYFFDSENLPIFSL
jgi:hypothetical protein